jgi:glutamate N-acetyltransferase / amino-acid N-acetyltransferase
MIEKVKCPGFKTAGIAAGIKKNGVKDLGLIFSETSASVAGVFTKNRVKAAPVLLDMERVKSGTGRALVVNSGIANCCTGAAGMADAREMTKSVARALDVPEQAVFVSSTGVIGEPLPMGTIEAAIPELVDALTGDDFSDLANAIMTTDTFPKAVSRQGNIGGKIFTVAGVAKGSGMIRPDMATMLSFICTDAVVSSDTLNKTLFSAVGCSYNRLTIDGDTSTNDTVLLMANGVSGANIDDPEGKATFQKVLDEVAIALSRALVKDGEGATKLVEIRVRGARTDSDARAVADTIAHSNLVKTAFFGEDANWGRIIAAAGRSGVELDPERLDLFFDDIQMVNNSTGCGKGVEAQATRVMKKPEFVVTLDLNLAHGVASVLTCDFSVDYVKINADYRS